jgi:hypothetical protein
MGKRIKGAVFYEGASVIDGSPIVGIVTFDARNAKVGNLVQTWIIRSDIHPMDAINSGADAAVCGSCPLRGRIAPASERIKKETSKFGGPTANKGRSCYVLVQQAPSQVFEAYKRGQYPKLDATMANRMAGKGLRYGSYGDPVAIPLEAWTNLERYCTGRSAPGYTHQWMNPRFAAWSTKVMASTHTLAENELASQMGWRTFRTITSIEQRSASEIVCPASAEGGMTASCETCGACNGRRNTADGRKSVVIVAHGGDGKLGLVQAVINRKAA